MRNSRQYHQTVYTNTDHHKKSNIIFFSFYNHHIIYVRIHQIDNNEEKNYFSKNGFQHPRFNPELHFSNINFVKKSIKL